MNFNVIYVIIEYKFIPAFDEKTLSKGKFIRFRGMIPFHAPFHPLEKLIYI